MIAKRSAILATGCPNWSRDAFLRVIAQLAARADVRAGLDAMERAGLARLVVELPARLEALYRCGLEDTLVHGDFHLANHRYDGHRLILLDWGDSGLGHPLLDTTAFLERVPTDRLNRVGQGWAAAWKMACPAADVSRAAELVRPIGALRQALIYRNFLDGIEASEQVYHREDPAFWLRRAVSY